MSPKESEARWKERLRRLAVSQQAQTLDLEKKLKARVDEAERRARLMAENTLKRCDEIQKARVAAYERETQLLLERMREELERRCAEAACAPMDAELDRVWAAMNGEEARE